MGKESGIWTVAVMFVIAIIVLSAVLAFRPNPAFAAGVALPVENYFEQQTLKGYDVLVDDSFHERHRALFPNNGFQNQFTGYHAAVDVEFTSPKDVQRDIPVFAAADGEVIYVGDVAGYGGVLVVRHREPEEVTTLYGHIRLSDLPVKVGDSVEAGQVIAYLGAPFSAETSGARKHLHFGVHKGSTLNLAGHEQSRERLLAEWYNPNDWLRSHGAGSPQTIRVSDAPTPLPTASPSPTPAATNDQNEQSWFTRLLNWITDLFR